MYHATYQLKKSIKVLTLGLILNCISVSGFSQDTAKTAAKDSFILNDSHFHLTNYVQEGVDIKKFLEIMGNKVEG
jgi:hypothetical protein